jgi:hypothetical protein
MTHKKLQQSNSFFILFSISYYFVQLRFEPKFFADNLP